MCRVMIEMIADLPICFKLFVLCVTEILRTVFTQLGFVVQVHNDLTAEAMRHELQRLGKRNFLSDDALVSIVRHPMSYNLST